MSRVRSVCGVLVGLSVTRPAWPPAQKQSSLFVSWCGPDAPGREGPLPRRDARSGHAEPRLGPFQEGRQNTWPLGVTMSMTTSGTRSWNLGYMQGGKLHVVKVKVVG